MRVLGVLAVLGCCVILAEPAVAQARTDGPLAATAAPAKPKPAPRSKKPAAKTHAAARATDTVPADGDAGDRAGSPSPKSVPRGTVARTPDPLSLGLKWNGSSDNAEQTRIQNYGGAAVGTGASVGLNYHF